MGRSESPLSGHDAWLLGFANDLRELRRQAGSPSYRELARRAHYSASSLSQAANGRSLPTLAVTLAFVTACGGDRATWTQRWRQVASSVTADSIDIPMPATEPEDPTTSSPSSTRPSEDPSPSRELSLNPSGGEEPPLLRRGGSRPFRVGLVVSAALLAVAVPSVVIATQPSGPASSARGIAVADTVSPSPSPHRVLGAPDPIADGSDPNRAGCGPDAVTMATTLVHFPADQVAGKIELRYSPHCRAAWARFTPTPNWHPGPGVVATVWTIRPADQASRQYTVEFGGEAIIGDMLLTAPGCVAVEATMVRGPVESPVATTMCWLFRTAAPTPG